MYGIGAGVVTGVVYNLALSRNPMKLAFTTYGLVTFGKSLQKVKGSTIELLTQVTTFNVATIIGRMSLR